MVRGKVPNLTGCAFVRMLVPHFRYPQSGYYQCGPNNKGDLSMIQQYQVVFTKRQMTDENGHVVSLLSSR